MNFKHIKTKTIKITLISPQPATSLVTTAAGCIFVLHTLIQCSPADSKSGGDSLRVYERTHYPVVMVFTRWSLNHQLILVAEVCVVYFRPLPNRVIPKKWNSAAVLAIPKSRQGAQIHKYRPMNLACIFCKCLEKLARTQVFMHLTWYGSPRGILKGGLCF